MTEVDTGTEQEKVIVRGIRGTVKWFSLYNHYGFINREDTGKDVFVHISGVIQRGKTRFALDAEQEVEMDIASGLKGEKAIAVTLPGGLPIENTRTIRFNRFGRRNKSKSEVETADEGEQPNQDNEGTRQAVAEKKSENGGGKRQKPRFNRRRRISTANDEGAQAGGDAEVDSTLLDKTEAEPKKGASEAGKGDKPVAEGDKKKESDKVKGVEAKPKSPVESKKEGGKAGAKSAEKPKGESVSLAQSLVDGVKSLFVGEEDGDASKNATSKTVEK